MVTRLSGTPLFAKSRLKKLIKAASGGLFYARQRVTTEGKSMGWVKCGDRVPDDEADVLCFGQYGDNDIDDERYQFMGWLSNKGIWRVSDGDSQNRRARVTNWMPLPEPPTE